MFIACSSKINAFLDLLLKNTMAYYMKMSCTSKKFYNIEPADFFGLPLF